MSSSNPPIPPEADALANSLRKQGLEVLARVAAALGRRVAEAERERHAARDELRSLSATINRFGDMGTLRSLRDANDRMEAAESERDAARAEVERMRTELREWAAECPICGWTTKSAEDPEDCSNCAGLRAALSPAEAQEEKPGECKRDPTSALTALPPKWRCMTHPGGSATFDRKTCCAVEAQEEKPMQINLVMPTAGTDFAESAIRAQIAARADARGHALEAFLRLLQADPSSVALVERRIGDGRTTTWTVEMQREPVATDAPGSALGAQDEPTPAPDYAAPDAVAEVREWLDALARVEAKRDAAERRIAELEVALRNEPRSTIGALRASGYRIHSDHVASVCALRAAAQSRARARQEERDEE